MFLKPHNKHVVVVLDWDASVLDVTVCITEFFNLW